MSQFVKIIYTIVIVSFIQGCASTPGVFNPENLPDSRLALLQEPNRKFKLFDYSLDVNILSVRDEDGNLVIGKKGFSLTAQDIWGKVKLKPGKYRLQIGCGNQLGGGTGYLDADVKAGDSLVISCGFDKNNRRKLDVKLVPYDEFYKDQT